MFKSALGVLFLLTSFAVAAPAVHAADVSPSQQAKKTSAKKSTAKNSVAKKSKAQRKKIIAKRSRANARNGSLDSREKLVRKVVRSQGKRKVVYQRVAYTPSIPAVPPVLTSGDLAGLNATHDPLALNSNVALVMDQENSEVLFEKNANVPLPVASITKLMTGLVVVEANQDMDEVLEVTADDIDREKNTSSRLRIGSRLTRANMLHIALMSSENRAASALGRHFPGGLKAFVATMNAKAKALGMRNTHYVEPTGLSSLNVASARDLAKLVIAAHEHPILRQYSTDEKYVVEPGGYALHYKNSNQLIIKSDWEIGLQKTGYIAEAGRCLVMQAKIDGRPVVMVFLDSKGKQSRIADAGRIRKWLETVKLQRSTES